MEIRVTHAATNGNDYSILVNIYKELVQDPPTHLDPIQIGVYKYALERGNVRIESVRPTDEEKEEGLRACDVYIYVDLTPGAIEKITEDNPEIEGFVMGRVNNHPGGVMDFLNKIMKEGGGS